MAQYLIPGWLFSVVVFFPLALQAQIDHTGGPDNFGYRWIDSDTTGGPDFYWVDISTMGALGPTGDDDCIQVSLPFTFSFYGQDKTSVNISTNGYLTFGTDGTDFSNDTIPASLDPNDYIAPFWHDLVTGTSDSTVHYYHDVNQNQFIVQYTNVSAFGAGGSYSFQVILHFDGSIVFQYLTMTKTVFLSGNLDANLLPKANVWSSDTPLTVGGVLAVGTDDLATLDQSSGLLAGDTIEITGNLPDGTALPVPITYTYAAGDGIDDLLAVIDAAYGGQATASFVNGKITLTDALDVNGKIVGTTLESGESTTRIALSSTKVALPAFENSVQGFTGTASITTSVYDGLGFSHNLLLTFTKTNVDGEWRWETVFVGGDEMIVSGSTGTVNFNSSGEVVSSDVDGVATGITVDPGTGAAQFTIQLDVKGGKGLSGVTQFASESNLEVTFATVGIEDSFGTDGLQMANYCSHRHDNFAVRIEPPTPVNIIGVVNHPTEFSLEQNHPNPFNPSTVIYYALPEVSDISLSIYDIMGREIRGWRMYEQLPGYYNIQWSGRDNLGGRVASGIYIYVLRANDFIDTKKMLLLK